MIGPSLRWGDGFEILWNTVLIVTAARNFGDCFADEVAKENGCALLYVGDDFAKTDLVGV